MEVITERKIKPIVIKIPEGYEYFNYDYIIRFEAQGNCTLVFSTRSEKPSKSLCNLLTIEKKYPHNSFLRCHKSHIINLAHVRKICIKIHKIIMEGEVAVPVSEKCLRDLKEMSNHSTF
jgi:DNA-binding LytR/AlgR family response regulator